MAAADVVLATGFAILNLGLAWVVGRVQPRRLVNGLVAATFLFNGVNVALATASGEGLGWNTRLLGALLDSQTFAIFLFLPFAYPRRRLGTRGLVALGVGASFVMATLALFAARAPLVGPTVLYPGSAPAILAYDLVSLLTFAVGGVLFLDHYLAARSDVQRGQARYFLAAYALKLGLIVSVVIRAGPGLDLVAGQGPLVSVVAYGAVIAALGAIPAGFLVSRLRAASTPRPLAEDAFVLAFAGLGLLFIFVLDARLESLLLRPLLLAYGMLRYQLLDVDAREHRGLLVTLLIVAVAQVFAAIYETATIQRLPGGLAGGVALAVSLGALALVAPPLFRRLGSDVGADERARAIYVAALEEALQRGPSPGSSTDRVLRALRGRLHISDREHAVLEAAASATLQGDATGPLVGYAYLGRYRIEAVLGQGGFGRTFRARDERMDRSVVLKVARVPGEDDARRLLAEGRLLARLRHPSVVTVYDVERVGADCVLVLEYVEGGSLAQKLAKGPLAPAEAYSIAADVLSALDAMHAHGIVHRDVKPGNILLTREGRAVLSDFGIARAPAGSGTAASYGLGGATAGTLRYMAPEQVRGTPVGPACDLYALGVVLHEMLTGRSYLDLDRRPDFDAARAIVDEEPPHPLLDLPAPIDALLRSVLAKDPADRPASAAQMRAGLPTAPAPPA